MIIPDMLKQPDNNLYAPYILRFLFLIIIMCCTKEKMQPDDAAQEYRFIINYSWILI